MTTPTQSEDQTGQPHDQGLFGPGSVTWQTAGAPTTGMAAGAAATMQMLVPRVMWMIDQASTFWEHPEERGRMTGLYGLTTTYGDTEAAERAGALLQSIHAKKVAVDPNTGEQYHADEQALLVWVQNTITFALLRAYNRWGPKLSPLEMDRFVAEQRISARLVGIDPPEQAAGNVAELMAYMDSMAPKLAFTPQARRFRDMVVPKYPGLTAKSFLTWLFTRPIVAILTAEQRELYGLTWGPFHGMLADLVMGLVLSTSTPKGPHAQVVSKLRGAAVDQAFGKGWRPAAMQQKAPVTGSSS